MDSFKKSSKSLEKAVSENSYKSYLQAFNDKKFFHEEKKNFSDPNKKSKFDMTESYYKRHMKPEKK